MNGEVSRVVTPVFQVGVNMCWIFKLLFGWFIYSLEFIRRPTLQETPFHLHHMTNDYMKCINDKMCFYCAFYIWADLKVFLSFSETFQTDLVQELFLIL